MSESMEVDSDDEQQFDMETESAQANKNLIAGKIVEIHVKNFLTHTEATVHPSEQLNLVIGPNGTGKSSIVASIIIGMGGSTKILSERNKLSDYVKNGKDVAKITVTIYRDERRNCTKFSREFNRQNKSTYHINDHKVPEKQYIEEIHKLNIQVGNLCQFLPQERVQDFAKQNPRELFASTQKSVCSDELIDCFEKLKELRSSQLDGDKQTKKIADLLQENERKVQQMQATVDDIRRQDELVRRKNVIEKKLAWMDFEEMFVKCKEVDKELKTIQQECEVYVKKRKDLEKHVAEKTKERQKYEKSLANETSKKKKHVEDLNRIAGEIEKLESELNQAKGDLDAYIQSAQEREYKINENQIVLNTYRQEYENNLETIGSVDQIKIQIQDIDRNVANTRDRIKRLTQTRNEIIYQIENVINPNMVHVDGKINALNSVADAKLNFLRNNFADAHTAVLWLRKNKGMFRGQIYEPMIMEMNVRSNEYAKYIENTMKVQDMIAFTCEETEDMNKFLKIMRIDNKLQVNAVHSPASNGLRFKSKVSINEVRKFGGEIYLIDTVEAPFPILNYLCQSYNFQNVLIGSTNLERKAEQLPASLVVFFTPTHRVQVKTSKYSNAKSLMSNEIKSKNILNVRVSQSELKDLEEQKKKLVQNRDQLRSKKFSIEENINALEGDCKTCFQEKSEHQKRIMELATMRKKIQQQEAKLQRIEEDAVDVDGEKEKFSRKAKEIVKKMLQFNENTIIVYEKMMEIELNEAKARARLQIFRKGTANYDAELMECNDEINRRKINCDKTGKALDELKQKTKEKQLIAMKMTENHKPSESNFPYKQDFDELSNDRKELSEEMDVLEEQVSRRTTNDQSVLDDYNKRMKTIERLKIDLRKGTKSSSELEAEIDAAHKNWFSKIDKIVKSINRNFSEFMNSMNCAGEVELKYPSIRDYEQYGIEIRVKYRNDEKLRALDRFVQSGGERAVAIAVYSLSLQHLSQVPFRCVDEINQGMDPNNERRVFEMLVNNVAKPGQSQFFYVTPKLQTNLPFNEYVDCITVFNGPYTNRNDYFENV